MRGFHANDRSLAMAMRVVGAMFLSMPVLLVGILLHWSILEPGGLLADLFRWQPFNTPYEGMILVVYGVWGFYLWRASADPGRELLFLDFTIAANLAHAALMLAFSFATLEHAHMIGDVVWIGAPALVLLALRAKAHPYRAAASRRRPRSPLAR